MACILSMCLRPSKEYSRNPYVQVIGMYKSLTEEKGSVQTVAIKLDSLEYHYMIKH